MPESQNPPVDLDLLTSMAKRFANFDMFEEARQLFEIALSLEPDNRGVQLGLAQIRHHLREEEGSRQRTAQEELREQFRRNAIDACHFFGLAALYWERNKPKLASECLEIALSKEPIHPFAYKLQGKHLMRQERWDDAGEALRTAKRFNPFDRQISRYLGDIAQAQGETEVALEAYIDAFLLLEEGRHPDEADELKVQIQGLKKLLGLRGPQLAACYRERRIKLQTDFDRLELQRERYLDHEAQREAKENNSGSRILLAARLRAVELWQNLSDVHVFQLTRVTKEEVYPADTPIFHYGDAGGDLFLIAEGEIQIRRPTPYGNFELARLPAGTLFGEVNFLSRAERSGDAVAVGKVKVVRLSATGMEELMLAQPDLGVEMYFCFWQGLAQKLRSANEQLRTFFEAEEKSAKSRLDETGTGSHVEMEFDEKASALQGLTGKELDILAQFSNVKRFKPGAYLFQEGDSGSEMYVILEGQVMISKYIPGGGEEALAILERGDFFGEMSLVDGQPRSADAKAYGGEVTVVAFDELTLREVKKDDAESSVQFLRLLCQMMSQRLREADERVTTWRIMAGHRPEENSDQISYDFPPAFAESA
jgi:CRP-like cAMP-binding protein/Tfp pilus assembly protein PilF